MKDILEFFFFKQHCIQKKILVNKFERKKDQLTWKKKKKSKDNSVRNKKFYNKGKKLLYNQKGNKQKIN